MYSTVFYRTQYVWRKDDFEGVKKLQVQIQVKT